MQNSFYLFKTPFLGKFGQKNLKFPFKLKFDGDFCWFCFCCLRPEIPFWSKFGLKNQNFQFKLKFAAKIISNMQNLMVIFNFSVFDQKYPFWANLVKNLKLF